MRFEKVSFEQYYKDICKEFSIKGMSGEDLAKIKEDAKKEWEDIIVPHRAHKSDAGYDFYSPFDFKLNEQQSIFIWTGIRVILDANKFLLMVPRSGLGTKYRLQIDNTVGIIDSGYALAPNEGHIAVKLTNDSKYHNPVQIEKGQAMVQGIILQYFTVDDDVPRMEGRQGGHGSTDKK